MFSRYLNTHFTKLGPSAANALLKAKERLLFAREQGSSPPSAEELGISRDFHVQLRVLCDAGWRAGAGDGGSIHVES